MLREKSLKLFLILLLVVLFLPVNAVADRKKESNKKVLVVHSYDPEYEWVSTISRGIKRIFESEKDILLEFYYLDTHHIKSDEGKEEAGKKARDIISQWHPDVVITVDDDAQKYVGRYYAGKDWPEIVFCGVSLSPDTYGYPADNVTGVIETSTLNYAVSFIDQNIHPVNSVSIISDTSSLSKTLIGSVADDIRTIGKKVSSVDTVETFGEWKKTVKSYENMDTDAVMVFLYDSVKSSVTGEIVTPKAVIEYTYMKSRKPVFGLSSGIVDDGALVGVIGSGVEQGRQAALIALGLLNGKKISDFPVKEIKSHIVLLNKKTADIIGVTLTDDIIRNIDVIVGE